jgi:sterol desaturase/sphingolipid hydroxylase (fatty acid hydroxylase superfamily)
MDLIISIGKGLLLGSSIAMLSFFLDISFSKKSFIKLCNESSEKYIQAVEAVQRNMMVISPLVYGVIDQSFIDHNSMTFQYNNIVSVLGIHSVGYYVVHTAMHKFKKLYTIHSFHHQYDKILLPSIGNAVSTMEFISAYLLPFIIAAYFLRPNEISFIIPIGIIGLLNIVIHCKELEDLPWAALFVSPKNHIEHHEVRTKHYAAPTINWDYFVSLFTNNKEHSS